jgi:hypothetical protein
MGMHTVLTRRTEPDTRQLVAPAKPNGPAAAAILAAGIGAFALGVLVIVSEALPAVKTALTVNARVGPLSGKTLVEVLVYGVAWIALAYVWRGKSVAFSRVYAATLILVALALLGTFPLVYEAFTAR